MFNEDMANKSITFSAAVRGFHVYKTNWKPVEGEILHCLQEENNPYDIFSIKVCKPNTQSNPQIVGHLPMEISRITTFILQRGASVQVKVTGKNYRRSPLVRGGLEVPCHVTVTMPGSVVNHLLITRYQQLLEELYIEPKDEEIIGTFLSVSNLNEVEADQPPKPPLRNKGKQRKPQEVKSTDIRQMFKAQKKNGRSNDAPVIVD